MGKKKQTNPVIDLDGNYKPFENSLTPMERTMEKLIRVLPELVNYKMSESLKELVDKITVSIEVQSKRGQCNMDTLPNMRNANETNTSHFVWAFSLEKMSEEAIKRNAKSVKIDKDKFFLDGASIFVAHSFMHGVQIAENIALGSKTGIYHSGKFKKIGELLGIEVSQSVDTKSGGWDTLKLSDDLKAKILKTFRAEIDETWNLYVDHASPSKPKKKKARIKKCRACGSHDIITVDKEQTE